MIEYRKLVPERKADIQNLPSDEANQMLKNGN